ncbi:MAG: tRNA-intron lyase [Thermoprotei archaeon]|nr:MAG: tRNA-intron lyase [Thermoprotei archaeon]RLF18796.1 MAG: tRNA-intron lyase [Thermoprotei archaeon]
MSKTDRIRAVLVGNRVIVFDEQRAYKLYEEGFYGKYVGISKPKMSEDEKRRPVELSLLEALYLLEKGRIEVVDINGNPVKYDKLLDIARANYDMFDEVYEVYKDLRSKGYVVRPGLKFGTTFAVYRYGPGIDHAPFLVHVMPFEAKLDPIEIIRAGRLSHSVRKRFIIAVVHPKTRRIHYYMFKWFKA